MKKLLQLKLYSLLSTKWGMAIFVIGLFFTFNSILQLMTVLVQSSKYFPIDSRILCLNNIAEVTPGQVYNSTMSLITTGGVQDNTTTVAPSNQNACFPDIDVVYTWVNGSDPRHKQG